MTPPVVFFDDDTRTYVSLGNKLFAIESDYFMPETSMVPDAPVESQIAADGPVSEKSVEEVPLPPQKSQNWVIVDNWDDLVAPILISPKRRRKNNLKRIKAKLLAKRLKRKSEDLTIPSDSETNIGDVKEFTIPDIPTHRNIYSSLEIQTASSNEGNRDSPSESTTFGWAVSPSFYDGLFHSFNKGRGQPYRDEFGHRGCARCGISFRSKSEINSHMKRCYYGENDLWGHDLDMYIRHVISLFDEVDEIPPGHNNNVHRGRNPINSIGEKQGVGNWLNPEIEPFVSRETSPAPAEVPEPQAESPPPLEETPPVANPEVIVKTGPPTESPFTKTPTVEEAYGTTQAPKVREFYASKMKRLGEARKKAPSRITVSAEIEIPPVYTREEARKIVAQMHHVKKETDKPKPDPVKLAGKIERGKKAAEAPFRRTIFFTDPRVEVPTTDEEDSEFERDGEEFFAEDTHVKPEVSIPRGKPSPRPEGGLDPTMRTREYFLSRVNNIKLILEERGIPQKNFPVILYCPTENEVCHFRAGAENINPKAASWLMHFINLEYFPKWCLYEYWKTDPHIKKVFDALFKLYLRSEMPYHDMNFKRIYTKAKDWQSIDLVKLSSQSWEWSKKNGWEVLPSDFTQHATTGNVCRYVLYNSDKPSVFDSIEQTEEPVCTPEQGLAIIQEMDVTTPFENAMKTMFSGITLLNTMQIGSIIASSVAVIISIRNVISLEKKSWIDTASLISVLVASFTSLVCSCIATYITAYGRKCLLAKVTDFVAVKKSMTKAFTGFFTETTEIQREKRDNACGLIMTAISSVIGLFSPEFEGFMEKRAKTIRNTEVVSNSVEDMWSKISGVFSNAEEPWEESAKSAVETLTSLNATPLSQYASLPFLNSRASKIADVEAVLKRLDALNKDAKASKTLQIYIARITSLLVMCDKTYTDAKSLDILSRVVRREPVGINFYGPPGHGKTHYVTYVLRPKIAAALGISSSYVISTGATKYAPKIGSENFYIADEFLFSGKEDFTLSCYTSLLSSGPCNMDSAFVKCQIPGFGVVFTISNKNPGAIDYGNAYGMSDSASDALLSRMNPIKLVDANRTDDQDRYSDQNDESKDLKFSFVGPNGKETFITEDQIIARIVEQYKKFEVDYQKRLAISVAEIEAQANMTTRQNESVLRPHVFTLFGKPGVGKSRLHETTAKALSLKFGIPLVKVDSDFIDYEHPCVYWIEDLVVRNPQGYCSFYDAINPLSIVLLSENFKITKTARLFSKDTYALIIGNHTPEGIYRRLSFTALREGARNKEEYMCRGSFDEMGFDKLKERAVSRFPSREPVSSYMDLINSVLEKNLYPKLIEEHHSGAEDTEPEVYDLVIDISTGPPPIAECMRIAICDFENLTTATIGDHAKLATLKNVVDSKCIKPVMMNYLTGLITIDEAVLQILDYISTIDQSITMQFIGSDKIISYHHGRAHTDNEGPIKEARAVRYNNGYYISVEPMTWISDAEADKIQEGKIREVPMFKYRDKEVRKRVTTAIKLARSAAAVDPDTTPLIIEEKKKEASKIKDILLRIKRIKGVWDVIKILLMIAVVVGTIAAGVKLWRTMRKKPEDTEILEVKSTFKLLKRKDEPDVLVEEKPGGATKQWYSTKAKIPSKKEQEEIAKQVNSEEVSTKEQGDSGSDKEEIEPLKKKGRGKDKVTKRNAVLDDSDDEDYNSSMRPAGQPFRARAWNGNTGEWEIREYDLQTLEKMLKEAQTPEKKKKWQKAIEMVKGPVERNMVKTVLPDQGISTTNSQLSIIQEKCEKNSCWVSYISPEGAVNGCIGHFIGGKYILTVSHIADASDKDPKYTIYEDGADWNADYVCELKERDVTLLKVREPTFPAKKSLLPFFCRNTDITEGNLMDVRLMLYTTRGVEVYHGANAQDMPENPNWGVLAGGSISHYNPHELRVDWVGIRDVPTEAGSCGSFYMLTSKKLESRRIVAIHTTLVRSLRETIGSIVTSDALIEMMRADGAECIRQGTTLKPELVGHKAKHPITGEEFYIMDKDYNAIKDVSSEAFDLPATDRFVQLGFCPALWRPCNSSKERFLRSPLHKHTTLPDQCKPAPQNVSELTPEAKAKLTTRDGKPHILGNQISYLAFDHKPCDKVILKEIEDFLVKNFGKFTHGLRPLNNSEVLNGVLNPNDPLYGNLGPINIEKSCGIIGKLDNRTRKSDYLEKVEQSPGNYTILWKKDKVSQEMKQRVKTIESVAKHGMKISCLIEDNTKVEMLPEEKADRGGTRCIKNSPIDAFLFQRKYAAPIQACLRRHRWEKGNPFVIGMNPYTETSVLYRELSKISNKGIALDFKRFDATCNKDIQEVVKNIQVRLYQDTLDPDDVVGREEIANVFEVIKFHNSQDMHICDGVLYMTDGSMNSGVYGTNKDDGFNNTVAWLYVAIKCWQKSKEYDPKMSIQSFLWNFFKSCRFFINGDDFIATMLAKVCEWLNYDTASVEYLAIGMVPDSPAKNGEGMITPIVSLKDMDFSSRHFNFDKGSDNVMGALKTISIEKAFHWTTSESKTDIVNAIHSALIEACVHGRSYYNKIVAEYNRCSKIIYNKNKLDLDYIPMTYEKMCNALWGERIESPKLNTIPAIDLTSELVDLALTEYQSKVGMTTNVPKKSVEERYNMDRDSGSEAEESPSTYHVSGGSHSVNIEYYELPRVVETTSGSKVRRLLLSACAARDLVSASGVPITDDPFKCGPQKERPPRGWTRTPRHDRRVLTIEFSDAFTEGEVEEYSQTVLMKILDEMAYDRHYKLRFQTENDDGWRPPPPTPHNEAETAAIPDDIPDEKPVSSTESGQQLSGASSLKKLEILETRSFAQCVLQGTCSSKDKPTDDLKQLVKFFQNTTYDEWKAYDPAIQDYLRAAQSYFDKRPHAVPLAMRIRLRLAEDTTDLVETIRQSTPQVGGDAMKNAFMTGKSGGSAATTMAPDIPASAEEIMHGDGASMPGTGPAELGIMNPAAMEGFGSVDPTWLDMVGPRMNLEDALYGQAYETGKGIITADAPLGQVLFETAYGDDKMPAIVKRYISLHRYASGGIEHGFQFTTGLTTNAQILCAWMPRGNGTATATSYGTYTTAELFRARRFCVLQLAGAENFVTVKCNDILLNKFVRGSDEFGLTLEKIDDRPRWVFVLWNSIQDLVGSNTVSVSWRIFTKVSEDFRCTDFDIASFTAMGAQGSPINCQITLDATKYLNIIGKTQMQLPIYPSKGAIQTAGKAYARVAPYLERSGLTTNVEGVTQGWDFTTVPITSIGQKNQDLLGAANFACFSTFCVFFEGDLDGYAEDILACEYTDGGDLAGCGFSAKYFEHDGEIYPSNFGGFLSAYKEYQAGISLGLGTAIHYYNPRAKNPLASFSWNWSMTPTTIYAQSEVSVDYEVPTNCETTTTLYRISSYQRDSGLVTSIMIWGAPVMLYHAASPGDPQDVTSDWNPKFKELKTFRLLGLDAPSFKYSSYPGTGIPPAGCMSVTFSGAPVSPTYVGQELNTVWAHDKTNHNVIINIYRILAGLGMYVPPYATSIFADLYTGSTKMGTLGFQPYYGITSIQINTNVNRGFISIDPTHYLTNFVVAQGNPNPPPFSSGYIQVVPEKASPTSERATGLDIKQFNRMVDRRIRELISDDAVDLAPRKKQSSWIGAILGGIGGAGAGAANAWQNQYDWKQRKDMQKYELENELDKIRLKHNFNAINSHYKGYNWGSNGGISHSGSKVNLGVSRSVLPQTTQNAHGSGAKSFKNSDWLQGKTQDYSYKRSDWTKLSNPNSRKSSTSSIVAGPKPATQTVKAQVHTEPAKAQQAGINKATPALSAPNGGGAVATT